MMVLYPIMEAIRSGGDLENIGGDGKYSKVVVCPDGCVMFRITAKPLGNPNPFKGNCFGWTLIYQQSWQVTNKRNWYEKYHPPNGIIKKPLFRRLVSVRPNKVRVALRRFWNNKFQSRRFLLKKWKTEGVLKLPIFKDTAVSGRYRHVLFYSVPL